ncbi:MAG: [acyl-carrier-protein] S-malonyltransferase [Candidatus Omnitrophica bacterium CG11_big_fil_rev_8_21_14_0_20_43_6]|nr:MAG: [acyl-carrier-protein] S-malonyltransferase [Candidatus Omnitrophica bacterium CG11_big_fil_rev_8_21_14_0_20_43_6]
MVGYLFAGQGSQYVGMGKDLCEAFPQSKAIFEKADKILEFSISELCFNGPLEELTKTNNCQPAIVATSIACWQAYLSKNQKIDGYMAGLSLGEYSALVAAGALNFEDAIYLVRRRGQFMEEEAAAHPGKMLSVIGLDLASVKEICAGTKAEVANINCPGQIVISGSAESIARAQVLAKEKGAKLAVVLEVSGAFHSSFMQGASQKLALELEKINLQPPKFPVICNVIGKPVLTAQEIKQNLIRQVSASVLWEDSMKLILSKGVTNFVEFGPGKVLKGLMRRIDSNARVANIEKVEDVNKL